MKFETIKKGDTVYIQCKVGGRGGFHPAVYGEFWLPKEVTKVTTKFFDAGGLRFNKESGNEHTARYGRKTALNVGEVEDQTEEHAKATALLRKLEKTQSLMYRYHVNHKVWSEEDLDALTELLTKNAPKK